ncbi:MAG TPA: glycoside hydrolase family 2 TIM barrel-domain containing protein, partial [Chthonomonadales bacterium]|nr:glycoside hydrolase family 2 TIM barrel-domain containing protein [Chthonomonadales bacterium]
MRERSFHSAAVRAPVHKDSKETDNGAGRATFELRPQLSLDGKWTFQFGESDPDFIPVPGPWESARPDLRNVAGSAVYERTFTLPAEFKGKAIFVHFGAVDYFAEVWINGVDVGCHEGGYTPFRMRIDHALSGFGPDAVNTILVRVTDSTVDQDATLPNGPVLRFSEIPHGKQSWYSSVGGLWQSVTIEARSEQHITAVRLLPDIDKGAIDLEVALSGWSGFNNNWLLHVHFGSPQGAPEIAPLTIPVPAQSGNEANSLTLSGVAAAPGSALWSPDSPSLYHARITLEVNGRVTDEETVRFGMRKVETREGRVWLNNHPFFIIGALDQDFYPGGIYTAPSREYVRAQLIRAKEMGLNLLRCHIKVPSPDYLELCDEVGVLVWYELPNGSQLTPRFRVRAIDTLQQMWLRDCNHPCIIIVSIMNESWGIDLGEREHRRWLAETYRWMKSLAPPWLVVDNSACIPNFHVSSDLDDYHIYFNIPDQAEDFAEWIKAFCNREAGTYTGYGDAEYGRQEPLLISEFGNWGLPHYSAILDQDGKEPYWFRTGEGPAQPAKVLERFALQRLDRTFANYDALADASQEQEWLSLKWEIEEMRSHPEVAGYVITEFTDVNWEC